MKQLLLILLLCLSVDVVAQTVYKDKKQDLILERVIQNSQPVYKVFFKSNYLLLGNKALTEMYLEEMLNVIATEKTVMTYVGNTSVKLEYKDEVVVVHARSSSFRLTKKQIVKIKEKLL